MPARSAVLVVVTDVGGGAKAAAEPAMMVRIASFILFVIYDLYTALPSSSDIDNSKKMRHLLFL
jgi:hypothetical protein